jgi:hypothetical protein
MPPNGNQNKTGEEEDIMKPRPSPEPYADPTIKSPGKTKTKRFPSIEPYRFAVEVVTLAFFLWYVDLTYWQMKSSSEQLREMQANRVLDERAWLSESDIKPVWADKDNSAILNVLYKNTGRTPALNVQCLTGWTKKPETIPKKDTVPDPPTTAAMIPPGGEFNSQTPLLPVLAGKKTAQVETPLYAFGTVWYDDVFGGHHWSQFALLLEKDSLNPSMIRSHPLTIHNSCDDAWKANSK